MKPRQLESNILRELSANVKLMAIFHAQVFGVTMAYCASADKNLCDDRDFWLLGEVKQEIFENKEKKSE